MDLLIADDEYKELFKINARWKNTVQINADTNSTITATTNNKTDDDD